MKSLIFAATVASLTAVASISFPGGEAGIGFDDLGYATAIDRVIVPGGRTGRLMLIDPATLKAETISGFSKDAEYAGGHGEGITSADEGHSFIFVTDRSSRRLSVIDEKTKKVVADAQLAAGPDYVRFVSETNEVWVTEPRAQRIEIFSLPEASTPTPAHVGFIDVPGGPESLVIDHSRSRAYTNLWSDKSIAIDVKDRKIVAHWPNGCKGSRGLALDERRGFLIVGCDEGMGSVLDVKRGTRLSEASSGSGVDIIAYNPRLAHLYLPAGDSATMATIGISSDGTVTVLGTVPTAHDSHCVAADDRDQVYVCDPRRGRILLFKDSLPASN
jgi:DNA-binding beta-propeller fold protein YncE